MKLFSAAFKSLPLGMIALILMAATSSGQDAPVTTDFPIESPVDTPDDSPDDSPVDSPDDSPVDSPIATDFPVESPADTPTTDSPTESPVESPPISGQNGCCSLDFKYCHGWGNCDASGIVTGECCHGTFWMNQGPDFSPCVKRAQTCTLDEDCCGGENSHCVTDEVHGWRTCLYVETMAFSPTLAPTSSPTTSPTSSPSKTPTSRPSSHPTKNPTLAPSESPTFAPTDLPTEFTTTLTTQKGRRLYAEADKTWLDGYGANYYSDPDSAPLSDIEQWTFQMVDCPFGQSDFCFTITNVGSDRRIYAMADDDDDAGVGATPEGYSTVWSDQTFYLESNGNGYFWIVNSRSERRLYAKNVISGEADCGARTTKRNWKGHVWSIPGLPSGYDI